MKIVPQQVKLVWITPNCEQIIEDAGRVAHQSTPVSTETGVLIKRLIKWKHESVLEHAVASFNIITDRGISHEIVRHRIASYTQESTRYCVYNDRITVIQPSFDKLPLAAIEEWKTSCRKAEQTYITLLRFGESPQFARSVLPTCLKTQLVMTANFREWRHFLRLRLSFKAHPQIQEIAQMILDKLIICAPNTFMDIQLNINETNSSNTKVS